MTPLISIIVSVYNVQPYLRQCVESLIGQTLHDIEIICVDDGSTDASGRILAEYASLDERVRVLTRENGGQGLARNTGLGIAQAPFIMFCDSDDWYEPTMCEKMFSAISKSESDIAVCGTQIYYECDIELEDSDRQYFMINFEGRQLINEFIILHTDAVVWNKIYRKSIIDQFDIRFPEGVKYEDAYFFNAYMMCSRSAFYLHEKLYHYRRRPGSTVNNTFKKKRGSSDHLRVAILLYEFCEARQCNVKYSLLLAAIFYDYYAFACSYVGSKEEKEYIAEVGATFAREHWDTLTGLPPSLARKIQLIKQNGRRIVRVFPLMISETFSWKKIYFLGIPLLKIKYWNDCIKYSLFGCFLIRRYNPMREFPANFTTPNPIHVR